MNITTIKNKLAQGKQYTARVGHSGDGLGNFKEELLGVVENNYTGPDLPELECKVMKEDTTSLLTLKTKAATLSPFAPDPGLTKAGKPKRTESYATTFVNRHLTHSSERQECYFDLKVGAVTKFAGKEFTLTRDTENIWVNSIEPTGDVVKEIGWSLSSIMDDDLTKKTPQFGIRTKCANLLLTRAKSERVEGIDDKTDLRTAKFTKTTHYEGFDDSKFLGLFDDGTITVSIRMHTKNKLRRDGRMSVRDHNPAFRTNPKELYRLYGSMTEHVIDSHT